MTEIAPARAAAGPPSPPPATTPAADQGDCPVAIAAIVALDAHDPRRLGGRSFAAILWSPFGPGVSTGVLWVNASGSAFHVPFTKRKVLSPSFAGEVDPIVFHLPADAQMEGAFVSDLTDGDDPVPSACRIAGTWVPRITRQLRDDLLHRFLAAAPAAPIEATAIADPKAACEAANSEARTIFVAGVQTPTAAYLRNITGVVTVLVRLGTDSDVIESRVLTSPNPLLNDSALQTARASVYRTEFVACRPIAANYIFAVEYDSAVQR